MSAEEKTENPSNSGKEENKETDRHEDHCGCGHDHHGDDKHEDDKHEDDKHEDHCGCGHDHQHGPNRKRRKRPPPPSHDDEPPYQPPPPPPLHPPQREPLMIEPLPTWIVPVPKVLEDGKVDCISTDPGKVVKTIIKPGTDNKLMHLNTRARVHFVGTLDDGTKFGSSRDKNEEFVYLYGKHEVVPGFDMALSTMHNGEIADVVIQPEYAYGNKQFDNIPPNSVLHFNIELVSYEWEPIEPMDQIEYAGEKREEGNAKVKEGKWQEAIDIYQKGYNFVEVLMIGDPGQHKLGQEMKLAIALNKAHCYLKLNQYDEALKMCNDALKVEPASAKGKFRRGMCYFGLRDYYRAEADFRSALVSTPDDKAIRAELQKVRAILDPVEKAQAAEFQKRNKGKNIFELMKVEEQKEEIARKERELKRIEQEKLKAEQEQLEKEKTEKEKAEKEKEEKEKADKENVEKNEGEGNIVKEPENAVTEGAGQAVAAEGIVKEEESGK